MGKNREPKNSLIMMRHILPYLKEIWFPAFPHPSPAGLVVLGQHAFPSRSKPNMQISAGLLHLQTENEYNSTTTSLGLCVKAQTFHSFPRERWRERETRRHPHKHQHITTHGKNTNTHLSVELATGINHRLVPEAVISILQEPFFFVPSRFESKTARDVGGRGMKGRRDGK